MFKEEKSEIEMSKELIELNSIEIIKNMFIDYDKNFEYYGDFPTLNLERKKAIETVLNLIKNQKAEIKKKDKQIDLITEFIKNNMSEKKIINEVCIKGKCNNEECHEDDLKQCIKQYYEKKAEEDK